MLGTRLGPYTIESVLGFGGMGSVYRATGPTGTVALKIVHRRLLKVPSAAARLRREIEIGQAISHPNVVRTFDGGEVGGRYYVAMELVEGQTLAALLEELERLPEALCRHVALEVCKGLGAIHDVGAIHRDVKPENVIITLEHHVKLMDLGVARSMNDKLRLSQSGVFIGSLRYASPEHLERGGKGLDVRSDLHALGAVLYELAGGVPAFDGEDVRSLIHAVVNQEPRRLGELNPQISPFFEELVHTLLAKNRDERFASVVALAEALADGEAGQWWRARSSALRRATKCPLRRVRIPNETALHGRESELVWLTRSYGQARSGEGCVMLLEGDAGVGKSRVVDELLRGLRDDGDELHLLHGQYAPAGEAPVVAGLAAAFHAYLGDQSVAPYLPELPALAPAFDALLRGSSPPADAEPLTTATLGACFVGAARSLAQDRVVVAVIEDLHFADANERSLFATLCAGVADHRVLLIGTLRSEVAADWVADVCAMPRTVRVSVGPLRPPAVEQMLVDALKSEQTAEALVEPVTDATGGNPLFVLHMLRSLRDANFLTQSSDATWVTARAADDYKMPASLPDLILAHVASLPAGDRRLLNVAACSGHTFEAVPLGALLGLSRVPVLRRLARIERQHGLVRATGAQYVFCHNRVQEVLRDALPETERREHRAAYLAACADEPRC